MLIENKRFDEERALYGLTNVKVRGCRFEGPADGESALKECSLLEATDCFFDLRYPFWHVTGAVIDKCNMTENCRAALWYDENIEIRSSTLHGIKALRECRDIKIDDCDIVSPEFLWRCGGIEISKSQITSEYPFFESKNLSMKEIKLKGKYSFQYVENATITDSVLDTKDAFWHSKNVTVKNCLVKGEYLGWYSENLKLIDCIIIGTQPLCYCKRLVLENCTTEDTDLSFEYSEVNATVKGKIDSIKNPVRGYIKADEIGEIIFDSPRVDENNTVIEIGKHR